MNPGFAVAGMGKAMRTTECYVERYTDHRDYAFILAQALGLEFSYNAPEMTSWYWPGFTEVALYEHFSDMTWSVKIKLRSGEQTVLCDPIEGFPSAKLINALNLLRE